MMKAMKRLKALINRCEGVSAIEFAIVLPLLLILFFGGLEVARLALAHQKLDKTVNAMADFVTRGTSVSVADLEGFARAVEYIMRPFAFDGTVIFSSVTNFSVAIPPCTGGVPCITWQNAQLGTDPSSLGLVGEVPTFPNGFELLPDQNVIVAELIYHHKPFLEVVSRIIPGLGPQDLYRIAVYKPRIGTLTELN